MKKVSDYERVSRSVDNSRLGSNLINRLVEEGLGSVECEKLLEYKNYARFRDDTGGSLPLFMNDGTRASRYLARMGYLDPSDRPNRYILSKKAEELMDKLGKD